MAGPRAPDHPHNSVSTTFESDDLIHAYTRADALADGVPTDVSAAAQEAGFKFPVALTAAAWAKCVVVPPGVRCQDEAGRLWDVLTVLRRAIRRGSGGARKVRFAVHVRNVNRRGVPPRVRLKDVCGPGDRGEPVLTVMMQEED